VYQISIVLCRGLQKHPSGQSLSTDSIVYDRHAGEAALSCIHYKHCAILRGGGALTRGLFGDARPGWTLALPLWSFACSEPVHDIRPETRLGLGLVSKSSKCVSGDARTGPKAEGSPNDEACIIQSSSTTVSDGKGAEESDVLCRVFFGGSREWPRRAV
jgi:hypothetical protein